MSRVALALRHVAFEDLGSFAEVLTARGFRIEYVDACTADLKSLDVPAPDLLVVLGGPIGVYETATYPFVADEIALVKRRLDSGKPVVGICLGAQLMAAALGAKVYPGPAREIGWKPVILSEAGRSSPLAELGETGPVLHWHGDTFDIPAGATLLASTDAVPHQAFSVGPAALALQFHPEAEPETMENWLVGHACELDRHRLDVNAIRRDSRGQGPGLRTRARRMFSRWLDEAGLV